MAPVEATACIVPHPVGLVGEPAPRVVARPVSSVNEIAPTTILPNFSKHHESSRYCFGKAVLTRYFPETLLDFEVGISLRILPSADWELTKSARNRLGSSGGTETVGVLFVQSPRSLCILFISL